MKSVLISISPEWVEKILDGKMRILPCKSRPKLETPFKCYIYCTKKRMTKHVANMYSYLHINSGYGTQFGKIDTWGQIGDVQVNGVGNPTSYISYGCAGKVVGEFVCNKIDAYPYREDFLLENESMYYIMDRECNKMGMTYEEIEEYGKGKDIYGWHISDLKIYDKPKELSEFIGFKKRPPASWCYVEKVYAD